jgi:hypothetical protein
VRLLSRVHAFLLRGYPRSYREAYGEEVAAVFQRMLLDASAQSSWRMWGVFLREAGELPFHLLAAYFSRARMAVIIEKILTNPKRSRWQQAGALGFALGFALMEALNGLAQLSSTGFHRYISWNHWIQVSVLNTPQGTYEVAPFQYLAVPFLAAAGMVAGLILGKAETPPKPIRFVLGGAVSLAGAYGLLYTVSLLVQRIPVGQSVISVGFNVLAVVLFGSLVALLLGWLTRGLRATRLDRLALAGLSGFFVGLLAMGLVTLGLGAIFLAVGEALAAVLGKIPYQNVFLSPFVPWISWGIGILGNAAMGWVFGSWVGRELGPRAPGNEILFPSR